MLQNYTGESKSWSYLSRWHNTGTDKRDLQGRNYGTTSTMIGKIPTRSDYASYEEQVAIEGIEYRFHFYWDDRVQSWYVSWGTLTEWIEQGMRLVGGGTLFRGKQHANLPPGFILPVDMQPINGSATDPTEDSLGTRHVMIYMPEDEIPEIEVFEPVVT